MEIIVTYDVPSRHVELKKKMFSKGYKDQIPGSTCKIVYFPNTTLYHANKSAKEAVNDVLAVCKELGIKLERCVSTEWTNWYAICGEDFK